MRNGTLVRRKTILISFSKSLEYELLSSSLPHDSLPEDLEMCAQKGLELLEELEDVQEIKHVEQIKKLIAEAKHYCEDVKSVKWHLPISEVLLDEIDLLMMVHGEDLVALGIKNLSYGMILILLVAAGLHHPDLALEARQP